MDELVRWLGEQLSTDESKARACSGNGEWDTRDIAIYGPRLAPEVREHMAAHDPARVLREIDAKRRIVERFAWLCEHGDTGGTAWVLPLLALPYADRPNYREEWRP